MKQKCSPFAIGLFLIARKKFHHDPLIAIFKHLIKSNKGGKKMGEIIIKDAVKREAGFLYYVDGKGNVCKAKMAQGRKKAK